MDQKTKLKTHDYELNSIIYIMIVACAFPIRTTMGRSSSGSKPCKTKTKHSHSSTYLCMASTCVIPRFALHAASLALSATEYDDELDDLVASSVVAAGASPDTDCLCSAYSSNRSRFDGGFLGRHDFMKLVLARNVEVSAAVVDGVIVS